MKGEKLAALRLMKEATDMEDSTSKHPVTPGEVLPARELYADLLVAQQKYEAAFREYIEVLKKEPNRFNSLYGAGLTAGKSGDIPAAIRYYAKLLSIAAAQSDRPELIEAKAFLKQH
jgi:tetratricopeptide (TPR) repeat protein